MGRLRLLTGGESHGPRLTAVLEGLPSVGLATGEASTTAYERPDVTAIGPSPVFVGAALALVLADALLERAGGDALSDLSAPPGKRTAHARPLVADANTRLRAPGIELRLFQATRCRCVNPAAFNSGPSRTRPCINL